MKSYAFIDASNLFYGGEKSLGFKIDYRKLKKYLEDKYRIKTKGREFDEAKLLLLGRHLQRVKFYNCLAENPPIRKDEGKQLHTSPADTGIDMEEPSFPQDACKLGKKTPAL